MGMGSHRRGFVVVVVVVFFVELQQNGKRVTIRSSLILGRIDQGTFLVGVAQDLA